MFHAHQSEFVELGWMSMFDVRAGAPHERPARWPGRCCRCAPDRADRWRLPGERSAADRSRLSVPPVEELTVERTVLDGEGIALLVRAGGSEPIAIAQVQVDGAYWTLHAGSAGAAAAARDGVAARSPTRGCMGETHHVVMLSRASGSPFEHTIDVALRDAGPAAAWARSGSSACSSASCRWRSGMLFYPALRPAAATRVRPSRSRSPSACCCSSSSTRSRRRSSSRREAAPGFQAGPWSGWSPRSPRRCCCWRSGAAGRQARGGRARDRDRARHRPPQSRRRAGDRLGIRHRRRGARHVPGARLHAPQRHRGRRHRRAAGRGAAPAADLRRPRRARGPAGGRGHLARQLRLRAALGGAGASRSAPARSSR